MGFFDRLFGRNKGSKPAQQPEPRPVPVTEPVITGLALYEKVVDLITVSGELRADLKSKLKEAFEHPASFYDDMNEFILSERGLTYPEDSSKTPKFVLIDTLIEYHEMAEVDWKECEEEIRFSLTTIISAMEYNLEFTLEDRYEGSHTYEVLEQIDRLELQPGGYALAILDIQSDCYVFTVVPLNKRDEVVSLFDQLK